MGQTIELATVRRWFLVSWISRGGRTKASDTCDVDHTFCVKGLKAGLLLKLIPHMILTQSLFSGNMDVRCWMWKFVGCSRIGCLL